MHRRQGRFIQIDGRYSKPGSCKFLKRMAHRWMRRVWKLDPENAPTRYEFVGYD